jgi:site-specific DNA recombinase
LLICAVCGRRLDGHWVNAKPADRCRHGHTSAHRTEADAPRWVYWSQARIIQQLPATVPQLAELGDAEALASYLRARDAVIVCVARTLTMQAAAVEETDTIPSTVDVTRCSIMAPRYARYLAAGRTQGSLEV